MLQQSNSCEDDQLLLNIIIEQMMCDSDPELGGAVQLSGKFHRFKFTRKLCLALIMNCCCCCCCWRYPAVADRPGEHAGIVEQVRKGRLPQLLLQAQHARAGGAAAVEHDRRPAPPRGLSDGPTARLDPRAALVLRRAPHIPHQELHPQQGSAQAHPGAHEVQAHVPSAQRAPLPAQDHLAQR